MSCRILSRGIEKQFFIEVIKQLDKKLDLYCEYIKSPKNSLVENLYEELGLSLEKNSGDVKVYKLSLANYKLEKISWISVK